MENIYVTTIKKAPNKEKIYTFDMYCNQLYEIDIVKGKITLMGNLDLEDDQVNLVMYINVFSEKLLLIPKNGKFIHIYDLENKSDKIYDKAALVPVNSTMGFFTLILSNVIYLICRDNGTIYQLNTRTHEINKISECKNKQMKILDGCTTKNELFVLQFDKKIIQRYEPQRNLRKLILLPDYIETLTKMYVIEDYIYIYSNKKNLIYEFDMEGNMIDCFCTNFQYTHIEPYLYIENNIITVFGNYGGEYCQINKFDKSVNNRILDFIKDLFVLYEGIYECREKGDDFIYGFESSNLYERKINQLIKINKRTLEISIQKLIMDSSLVPELILRHKKNVEDEYRKNRLTDESLGKTIRTFINYVKDL